MQAEGAARSKALRPVADAIDTWRPQLRAVLEMNVFNPEAPLKEMDLDDEALKDRYLISPRPESQSLPGGPGLRKGDVVHRCLWP